ncbi:MAG: Gldg family protein, partial [Proteobacteria bacterium]|nr:Gldg family protein [Pseudomonadota bacterium]
NGELVIENSGRIERTTVYSEQAVTEALARLARASERWIVFVKGHGERSPTRGANYDLSDWVEALEKRGFNIQEINLAELDVVPDNTTVLVIASPQVEYQARESNTVLKYLARGGNLLWFAEPDSPPGLIDLEHKVGFERIPGTIIDPLTAANGIDNPAFILLNNYAAHAATDGFNYTSVFFYATGLHERVPDGWQASRLILSGDKAWSETQELSGNVGYETANDYLGPLPVSLALSRTRGGHEQRVIVVGDGDFLANAYLHNSGNQDLGVRLVEWLSQDDLMVGVASRTAIDNRLDLKDWHTVIGFGFLIVLPIAFAMNGLLIWWRRRRA